MLIAMAGDPPVRVAESAPRHVLSHTEAGLRGRAGIDDADRPLSSEIPLLWQLSYPRLAGGAGTPGESEEGPAPDAGDGYGGAVSKAQPQSGEPGLQGVSVPAAGSGHRLSESGMGHGYYLHPDGPGFCVPGRDHGLVLARGACWVVFRILCHFYTPDKKEMIHEKRNPVWYRSQFRSQFDMEAAIQALRQGKDLSGKDGVLPPS